MKSCTLLVLLAAALLPIGSVRAAQADHVTATHAWIRLLPSDLPAAGYVTLQNNDSNTATLITARSKTYASVMLHQSMQGTTGMNSMVMVEHLTIPAHGAISLAPASYHLMLEQAVYPLKTGDNVEITLDFADGSQLPVHFLVQPANAVDEN